MLGHGHGPSEGRRDGHGGVGQRIVRVDRRDGHRDGDLPACRVSGRTLDVHVCGGSYSVRDRLGLRRCVRSSFRLAERACAVCVRHTHAHRRDPDGRGCEGDLELRRGVDQDARIVGRQRGVVVLGHGHGPSEGRRDGHGGGREGIVRVRTGSFGRDKL